MSNLINNSFLQLVQELPAKKLHWSKCHALTLEEALFISYGVEPPTELDPILRLNFIPFLQMVDIHHIWKLSKRAIATGDLLISGDGYIKAKDFVDWANQNDIPIQREFFFYPINEDIKEKNEDSPPFEINSNDFKKQIKNFDLKKFTMNELGILQARIVAAARWKNDENLSQTDIVDDENFSNHLKNLYDISGSKFDEQKEMRTEWISDLDPREKKVGRKKTINKSSSK